MTLVVTVNGRESIWMLADRRLSIPGRRPRDDAVKLAILEAQDGIALLSNAGPGATGIGTQLSDWMEAVLRGSNLPLEGSLNLLAAAMKRQLPRHVAQIPGAGGPTHTLVASAMMADGEVRLYAVQLAITPDRRRYSSRYVRNVTADSVGAARPRSSPIALAGSGGQLLLRRDRRWMRDLLRLVHASDEGKVPPHVVADQLASLNKSVSEEDPFVSPQSIVAWRNRKGGVHGGGGDNECYIGIERDPNGVAVPIVSGGITMRALFRGLTHWERNPGSGPIDFGQKPPDEKLR